MLALIIVNYCYLYFFGVVGIKSGLGKNNPHFLKPFKYGWKRELVYRATYDNLLKRNGDVYYHTPGGKKVRSMREVAENLKNKELTLDDFTFTKEPLGLDDPEKEIVRDAMYKSSPSSTSSGEGKGKKGTRSSPPKSGAALKVSNLQTDTT